jgi:hypothetical protein
MALTAGNYSGVIYVGLGDCFDDDRRFVREMVSRREARIRLVARLTQGAGPPGHWRAGPDQSHDTGTATKPTTYDHSQAPARPGEGGSN